jgi:hypothetical protein
MLRCTYCRYASINTERCYARALLGLSGSGSYKTQAKKQGYCEFYNGRGALSVRKSKKRK